MSESSRKAVRARLASGIEAEISTLRVPSAPTRLLELLFFSAMWIFGGWLVMFGLTHEGMAHWGPRLTGTFIIALALHALALMLHDGVHGTLLANRRANRAVSVLLGGCV